MNGVCTNILHMHQKKIATYAGNYDTYVTARKQKEDEQMKKYNWEQEQVWRTSDSTARYPQIKQFANFGVDFSVSSPEYSTQLVDH